MGIEIAVFEDAAALWISRMQHDTTWEVTTLFGKHFGESDSCPKLSALQPNIRETNLENLELLKNDRYFYEELYGARVAAYEYGLDGAQWTQDTFGINLEDFQSISIQYMKIRNTENSNDNLHYFNYMQEKQKKYAALFAKVQDRNIADNESI